MLHSKKEVFIDNKDGVEEEKSKKEQEADALSEYFLIPSDRLKNFVGAQRVWKGRPFLDGESIQRFATESRGSS